MAIYKGKPTEVRLDVNTVYQKISNIGAYQQRLEELPKEARDKLGDVKFTDDAIVINTPPVGEIRFAVVERCEPSLLRLAAEQSPVPFEITIHLQGTPTDTTTVATELNVEIPAMLKPLVGGKLQEAADKFSDLMSIFFA